MRDVNLFSELYRRNEVKVKVKYEIFWWFVDPGINIRILESKMDKEHNQWHSVVTGDESLVLF
jgi:hypothetical protein